MLGLCIGIRFGDALKSGLKVGVGFVGLSIVTALLTSALGPALNKVVEIYDLQLKVFDMGWPAAASVAYNTAVGAFVIPVCLGVNLLMLFTKTTRTVNIDLWNYWHFAFIGAVVYFASDSLVWGFFAAIVCYVITLVIADMTARKFQNFYEGMDGISIPQPFCAGFVPFAIGVNWLFDKIPGANKIDADAEGLKKKFGVLGEPLMLGVIVGVGIGCLTCESWKEIVDNIPYILGLGIKMGAVMELIPRVTVLFIEGLKPISEATRSLISRRFKGADGLNIGMSPALCNRSSRHTRGIYSAHTCDTALCRCASGQPVPSLGFIGGNVLSVSSDAAVYERQCGQDIRCRTCGDSRWSLYGYKYGTRIYDCRRRCVLGNRRCSRGDSCGFDGGSLDFASSPLSWIIYQCSCNLKWIGAGLLVAVALGMAVFNRILIVRNQKAMIASGSDRLQKTE